MPVTEMPHLAIIMPVIAACMGALLSIMLGMALSKLTTIQSHLEKLNGKFYDHVTTANVHEAGFAKVEEQIKNLLQTVKIAHERIDKVKDG